jgi:hypothetical protein
MISCRRSLWVGLTVEVLFDVVGLDLQLLADVEQER